MKDEICINTFAVGNEVDTVNNGQVKSLSLPSFLFLFQVHLTKKVISV